MIRSDWGTDDAVAPQAPEARVPPARLRDLGRTEYRETWQAMRAFTEARGPDTPDELWLVEHPPVFTLGQAGRGEHVHAPGAIPVIATDRGGQVTYHGPGQVVVYTLVDLRRTGFFVRELVRRIEEAVIETLASYGVAGFRVDGAPGVYVHSPACSEEGTHQRNPAAGFPAGEANRAGRDAERNPDPDPRFLDRAKIAALGIKVHRGCAYHGVALNVAMDLAPYSRIDPCGYPGLRATDLATLGVRPDRLAVGERLLECVRAQIFPD